LLFFAFVPCFFRLLAFNQPIFLSRQAIFDQCRKGLQRTLIILVPLLERHVEH
jgi:hypothetical protein